MKHTYYAFAAFVLAFIYSSCSTSPDVPLEESPCPKVNVAPHYQVDSSWPKDSEKLPWSDMPGVAIDKTGNVWRWTNKETFTLAILSGNEYRSSC